MARRYADSLVSGTRLALFGKVELERGARSRLMVQPEIEILSDDDEDDALLHSGRIVPVYEAASKISTRVFRKLINRLLKELPMPEDALPRSVRARVPDLPDLAKALEEIHSPGPDAEVGLLNEFRSPGQQRLIFDEFFWLECGLALKRYEGRSKRPGISFEFTRPRAGNRSKPCFRSNLPARRSVCMQEIADGYEAAASDEPAAAGRRRQRKNAGSSSSRHHCH